jgi:hypothetical protein
MQKLTTILPDAMIVVGGALLSYGAGLLHPAAGYAVGGLLMLAFGVLAARNNKAGE